ncbi:MAG: hypothetical protein CBB87_01445 [Micavibrio sp. TMED27]|nr:hypothetical protein [Micavibrio sp.]OUT92434.1 MAG: hypothetical protein CBB87_01445 [Micavibrio sp. TMED27]|tara:strand:+ start:720 stop:1109 length:390 start_codon:yes stop_codon:yes gene_type:complete
MSKKKKCTDGRRKNRPPVEHQFKPKQSGNPAGRPRKKKSSFTDDIKFVFGREREITIDGEPQNRNIRQLILEQIGIGAAKGDPKMIKLAIPFLKIMDDAPEFELLPEDRKVIEDFKKRFKDNGEPDDED